MKYRIVIEFKIEFKTSHISLSTKKFISIVMFVSTLKVSMSAHKYNPFLQCLSDPWSLDEFISSAS